MMILVRHGQTAANAAGLLQGRVDLPLTDLGLRQAEALGRALGGPGVSRVVSSPLERAWRTAAMIAGEVEVEVEVDPRWIEVDYGDFDGQPLTAVSPEEWEHWRQDPDFRLPGGETLAECAARVGSACADLASEAAESDVVVVSHVSPIKAAVAWALAAPESVTWRMFLGVASVTRIGFGPRGPSLLSYNETHHLPGFTRP